MIIDWKTDSLHYEREVRQAKRKLQYRCPICKRKSALIRHGYYQRNVVVWVGRVIEKPMVILRAFCPVCGHTHAVLPFDVIPHRVYSLSFYWKVLRMLIMECAKVSRCTRTLETDYQTIYRLMQEYKRFLSQYRKQFFLWLLIGNAFALLKWCKLRQILYYTTLFENSQYV